MSFSALTYSKYISERVIAPPNLEDLGSQSMINQVKTPVFRLRLLLGELTHINLEHLFDDLFRLRDRFKELGMVIKDGQVYLPDLEERNA